MISRRNIRVKVMQTLYSLETQDSQISSPDAVKLLKKHFDQSRGLLVYMRTSLLKLLAILKQTRVIRPPNTFHLAKDLL